MVLKEEGILKILDFGLARTYTDEDGMSTQIGTPFYWAPEIRGGKTNYDEKVD